MEPMRSQGSGGNAGGPDGAGGEQAAARERAAHQPSYFLHGRPALISGSDDTGVVG